MKHALLTLCLFGLLVPVVGTAEERREDTATYRVSEPDTPTLLSVPVEVLRQSPAARVTTPTALAELRSRHQADTAALERALLATDDQDERAALERQAAALKLTQRREELEWRRSDALARGAAATVARLDEALRELEPRPLPAATTCVPRDPLSGQALVGRTEGGAQ
ncbi:MAG: hypothetical protein WC326_04600 [Candidatus Delongbacteria bacterium]